MAWYQFPRWKSKLCGIRVLTEVWSVPWWSIDEVTHVFRQVSTWKLRDIATHEVPRLWTKKGKIISMDLIREYFVRSVLVWLEEELSLSHWNWRYFQKENSPQLLGSGLLAKIGWFWRPTLRGCHHGKERNAWFGLRTFDDSYIPAGGKSFVKRSSKAIEFPLAEQRPLTFWHWKQPYEACYQCQTIRMLLCLFCGQFLKSSLVAPQISTL